MSALQQVLRERAIRFLMKNQAVPNKSATKKSVRKPDWAGLSRFPGSSRSVTLDAIKGIASKETGCLVATPSEEARIGQLGVRAGRVVVVRKVGKRA